jgi:hypothetical protein
VTSFQIAIAILGIIALALALWAIRTLAAMLLTLPLQHDPTPPDDDPARAEKADEDLARKIM